MRVRPVIVALLVSLGGTSLTAAPAAALESGVFVDPNSPAGKEYSFPLDVSRGEAVGHTAPQGVAEPLFGVGIGRAGASGHRRRASTRGPSALSTGQLAPAPALDGLGGHHSPAPEEALIVAPVLVGGFALGVALAAVRRRRG